MACYKTLSLRIYRPGAQKRLIMDEAILRYTCALEALLRRCRERVLALAEAGKPVLRAQALALAGADDLRALNVFGIQPFKDSLRQDFARMVLGFLSHWKKTGGNAAYPCVRIEPGELDERFADLTARYDAGELSDRTFRTETNALFLHCERLHSLYFGRYAENRDYCLLYDPVSRRFYAKLHLLNAKDRLPAPPAGKTLRVVAPGLPPAKTGRSKRRFIVVPLAFGRAQETLLRQALDCPKILHTARLLRRKDAYYLILSVEAAVRPRIPVRSTMGVARTGGGLTYTVCDGDGAVRESGRITPVPGRQMLFLLAGEVVRTAAKAGSQVILEANGGRGDSFVRRGGSSGRSGVFPAVQYARLGQILRYKLPEAGLPAPVFLSGNGINTACPRCGASTYKNRLTPRLFACISCGYAGPFEYIGSRNLAMKLKKYAANRVPVYVKELPDGSHLYYNHTLSFSCTLAASEGDGRVLYELSLMAKGSAGTWHEGRQYSMLCKLRTADDIRSAVRWVPMK